MTPTGKRRIAEEPEVINETPVQEEAPATKRNRRHRASYPTPGFKAFGTLLNVLALLLGVFLITQSSSFQVMVLGLLAALGLVIALYSLIIKPLATNVGRRKMLTTVVVVYGFLSLLALSATFLLG